MWDDFKWELLEHYQSRIKAVNNKLNRINIFVAWDQGSLWNRVWDKHDEIRGISLGKAIWAKDGVPVRAYTLIFNSDFKAGEKLSLSVN